MSQISIIIPVFNVEKYLADCLDSVLAQTFEDFEVILVNDGSTDQSPEICRRYVENDSRFILLNQKNQGLSAARNFGLMNSNSKYIYFLDSDDWIEKTCLEELIAIAVSGQYDIVVHNVNKIEGGVVNRKKIWTIPGNKEVTRDDLSGQVLIQPCWAWNKLYSREFLIKNKLLFVNGLHYEDVPFFVECILTAKKIYYTESYLINYRVSREGSITTEKGFKSLDILRVEKIVSGILKKYKAPACIYENFADWIKWNYAWMYVKLPNWMHSIFFIWILRKDKKTISDVLDALGMRMNVVSIFGLPCIFLRFHNEKLTVSLFGILPLYLRHIVRQ